MSRLMAIGVDWLYRGEYDSLSDIVAHVRAVTLEKVIEVARKYPLKNWSQFLLLPEA